MSRTKKQMESMKATGRFTVMSIPGRDDDGNDTNWFIWDRMRDTSIALYATYADAAAECRLRNRNV